MTQLSVEETLLREPNLWIPGKKPVGNVKIDWSHPFTKDLIFATINGLDLVHSVPGGIRLPNGWFRGAGVSPYSANEDTAVNTVLAEIEYTSNNGDWAGVDNGYYVSNTDNLQVGFGLWGSSNNLWLSCRRNSASGFFQSKAITFPYKAILWHRSDFGDTGDFAQKLYENGTLLADAEKSGTYSQDSRRKYTAFDTTSTGKNCNWAFRFKADVSIAVLDSISLDPYQFLIPA